MPSLQPHPCLALHPNSSVSLPLLYCCVLTSSFRIRLGKKYNVPNPLTEVSSKASTPSEASVMASPSSATVPSFAQLSAAPAPSSPLIAESESNFGVMLTKFYQTYNPAKVGEVQKTLDKYKGREPEMFTKLSQKYKAPNPLDGATATSGTAVSGGFGSNSTIAPAAVGDTSSSGGFASFGSAASKPVQPATAFGSAPAPAPSGSLFGSGSGPVPSPFGGSPAPAPFGAGAPPAGHSPFGKSAPPPSPFGQPSTLGGAAPGPVSATPFGSAPPTGTTPFGQASSSPSPFGAPSGAASLKTFNGKTAREMLVSFYQERNPSKIAEVDKVLGKYAGQEEQLFRNLAKKYNLNPTAFGVSAAAPASAPGTFTSAPFGGAQSSGGFGQSSSLGGGPGFGSASPAAPSGGFGHSSTIGGGATPFGSSPASSGFGGASAPSPGFGGLTQAPPSGGGFAGGGGFGSGAGGFSSPGTNVFGSARR